ncbi:MAG: hypothetical protein AAF567_05860 [Actinomycetota bacterium]
MPLAQAQIEEAAAFLFHLHVQRQKAPALPHEIAPTSVDDAYAIQDAIHKSAGWPIALYKVGCTSELAQQVLGIPHPIGGRVPSDGVFADGESIPLTFFGAPPAIECEFALQVDGSGTVVAVAPAIELVDPRVQSSGGFGGLTTIADNSAGCAVVIGEPMPIADAGDLASHAVRLTDSGGAELASGSADAVIGGPSSSVDWTIAHERDRGRELPEGAWIITGTCTGLTPTEAGGSYVADYGALGTVGFSLG